MRTIVLIVLTLPIVGAACSSPEAAPEVRAEAWVYSANLNGNVEIFLRCGEPTDPDPRVLGFRLTDSEGLDNSPRISPDGTKVVFSSMRDGDREIYVMDIDGGNPRNLTRHPEDDLLPSWSPDGEQILFFSTRGYERGSIGPYPGALYRMPASGGEVERLIEEPLTSSLSGDYSPDGRQVVFARAGEDGIDLFLLDLASGEERRVTDTAGQSEYTARFSKDGAELYFHVADSTGARIARIDLDAPRPATPEVVVDLPGERYGPVSYSEGTGFTYALVRENGRAAVAQWDPATGRETRPVETELDHRGADFGMVDCRAVAGARVRPSTLP